MAKVNIKSARLPWSTPSTGGDFKREKPNQDFYNSASWRRASNAYRSANPLCEISKATPTKDYLPAEVTDHIVPINQGGAMYDERNFMSMSHYWHNIKSSHESRKSVLVSVRTNESGYLIPSNRNDIIEFLLNKQAKI